MPNTLKIPSSIQEIGLIDADKNGVMMEWEAPLMREHAKIICPEPWSNRPLNVGKFFVSFLNTHSIIFTLKFPDHHIVINVSRILEWELLMRLYKSSNQNAM